MKSLDRLELYASTFDGTTKYELQELAEGIGDETCELESLVEFMEPFFMFAISHGCGCPNDYAEPHDCDKGCKALGEFRQRIAALGKEVGE